MKIFISWSGEQAKALAKELQDFVRLVVPGTAPWRSAGGGVEPGSRSLAEIAKNLEGARAGMICLTSDNLAEPWILFEAGALSRTTSDKVWTVLLDLGKADVPNPLGMFQHTVVTDVDSVWEMVQSINRLVEPPRLETDLREMFDLRWPKLKDRVVEIQAMPQAAPVKPRPPEEMLAELLDVVRGLTRDLGADRWKVEKTLKMLHHVYQATTGKKAPTLEEFRRMDAIGAAFDWLSDHDSLKGDSRLAVTRELLIDRLMREQAGNVAGADALRSFSSDTSLPLRDAQAKGTESPKDDEPEQS